MPNTNIHDKQLYKIRSKNCKGWGPYSSDTRISRIVSEVINNQNQWGHIWGHWRKVIKASTCWERVDFISQSFPYNLTYFPKKKARHRRLFMMLLILLCLKTNIHVSLELAFCWSCELLYRFREFFHRRCLWNFTKVRAKSLGIISREWIDSTNGYSPLCILALGIIARKDATTKTWTIQAHCCLKGKICSIFNSLPHVANSSILISESKTWSGFGGATHFYRVLVG